MIYLVQLNKKASWFGLYEGGRILMSGTLIECLHARTRMQERGCACGAGCDDDAMLGMPLCTAQELGDV